VVVLGTGSRREVVWIRIEIVLLVDLVRNAWDREVRASRREIWRKECILSLGEWC